MTERIIAKTAKWKVTLKEAVIKVDLYDLVSSDREVMSILDAYKKAYDTRHGAIRIKGMM